MFKLSAKAGMFAVGTLLLIVALFGTAELVYNYATYAKLRRMRWIEMFRTKEQCQYLLAALGAFFWGHATYFAFPGVTGCLPFKRFRSAKRSGEALH